MHFLKNYIQKTPPQQQQESVIAYLASLDFISKKHPKIAQAILDEIRDQRSYLKLIASENYSSLASQLAMGNLLTDKYAEGYPCHRFYAGCENIDTIEKIAAQEACSLFHSPYAYVQPHSGADANLVAFFAILFQRIQQPFLEDLHIKNIDALSPQQHENLRQKMMNQRLLGMSLNSGGHLTHGYRLNLSSKIFQAASYDVDRKTGLLDYAAIAKQAKEQKPLVLLAGYSAYPRRIDFAAMREIADSVGATLMVDMAHFAGLVAGKAFQGVENPVPYAHIITTTTHKTLRGPRGGLILATNEYADAVNRGCPMVLGGPLPHVMAAKAVAFAEAGQKEFQTYALRVIENARCLADRLMKHNVSVVTNGTDNHLVLFDVSSFGLTGRQAEIALRSAHMTANRNAVPFDANGPWYTSGIRLGTPALTTLGFRKEEMEIVADLIVDVLRHTQVEKDATGKPSRTKCRVEEKVLHRTQSRVKELLDRFPLYPELVIST